MIQVWYRKNHMTFKLPQVCVFTLLFFPHVKVTRQGEGKTVEVNISEMIVISVVYACNVGTAKICCNVRKFMMRVVSNAKNQILNLTHYPFN
jgi:hypothetical protein